MNLLWPKDTPRAQKWLISLFVLMMLGALVPLVHRSFVPTLQWQKTALAIAALLTATLSGWLWWQRRQGLWQPAGPWLAFGPVKRLLMVPLCLAFLTFMLWLNVAVTLPMAYTAWAGEALARPTIVEKKRGTGRSCRHQLQVPEARYIFFQFCIDQDAFEGLPDGPLPARLSSRRSRLGETIHTLELAVPRHARP